jgi:hypothetical protein
MLHPSDLRINNVIQYNGELLTVHSYDFANLDWSKAEGIGLTGETLEKCGFAKSLTIYKPEFNFKYYDYRKGNMICNYNEKWDSVEVEYSGNNIEHRTFISRCTDVHELQNLYHALTGEEIQVNL